MRKCHSEILKLGVYKYPSNAGTRIPKPADTGNTGMGRCECGYGYQVKNSAGTRTRGLVTLVESHADRRNKEIETYLCKGRERPITEVFLLGARGSGRSEVFNCLRFKSMETFSEAERRELKVPILKHAISGMKALLQLLENISIEYEPPPPSQKTLLDDEEIEILQAMKRLWNDTLFQTRLNKSPQCLTLLEGVLVFCEFGFWILYGFGPL